VPWAVGGPTDQLVRLVAEYWPLASPLPLAVRNATGSGGTIGAREVLTARPDGYTLLAAHESLLTAYYLGQASFTWTDFEPVGGMFSLPELVVTRKNRPWRDVAELLDDAQRRPEQITWAATFGSRSHFLPGEIMYRSGARFKLVGYDGAGSCLAALLAGEVDVANASLAALQEPARGGKLRLLGSTGAERAAALPDLPTLREQGLDVSFAINLGLLAPKGTPPDALTRLEQSLELVLADADLQQRARDEQQAQVRFLPRRAYAERLSQLDGAIRLVAENLGLRA
jgi:tripartite-type tricarboxylate transporter receptor subunit TctC